MHWVLTQKKKDLILRRTTLDNVSKIVVPSYVCIICFAGVNWGQSRGFVPSFLLLKNYVIFPLIIWSSCLDLYFLLEIAKSMLPWYKIYSICFPFSLTRDFINAGNLSEADLRIVPSGSGGTIFNFEWFLIHHNFKLVRQVSEI